MGHQFLRAVFLMIASVFGFIHSAEATVYYNDCTFGLRIDLAEKEHALGMQAKAKGDFKTASEYFLRGIDLIGNRYSQPKRIDDSGQKLVAAFDAERQSKLDIAANIRSRVLKARLTLSKEKVECSAEDLELLRSLRIDPLWLLYSDHFYQGIWDGSSNIVDVMISEFGERSYADKVKLVDYTGKLISGEYTSKQLSQIWNVANFGIFLAGNDSYFQVIQEFHMEARKWVKFVHPDSLELLDNWSLVRDRLKIGKQGDPTMILEFRSTDPFPYTADLIVFSKDAPVDLFITKVEVGTSKGGLISNYEGLTPDFQKTAGFYRSELVDVLLADDLLMEAYRNDKGFVPIQIEYTYRGINKKKEFLIEER